LSFKKVYIQTSLCKCGKIGIRRIAALGQDQQWREFESTAPRNNFEKSNYLRFELLPDSPGKTSLKTSLQGRWCYLCFFVETDSAVPRHQKITDVEIRSDFKLEAFCPLNCSEEKILPLLDSGELIRKYADCFSLGFGVCFELKDDHCFFISRNDVEYDRNGVPIRLLSKVDRLELFTFHATKSVRTIGTYEIGKEKLALLYPGWREQKGPAVGFLELRSGKVMDYLRAVLSDKLLRDIKLQERLVQVQPEIKKACEVLIDALSEKSFREEVLKDGQCTEEELDQATERLFEEALPWIEAADLSSDLIRRAVSANEGMMNRLVEQMRHEQKADANKAEAKIAASLSHLEGLKQQEADLRKHIDAMKQEAGELQKKNEAASLDGTELHARAEKLECQLKQKEKELNAAQSEISKLRTGNEELQDAVRLLKQDKEEIARRLNDKSRQYELQTKELDKAQALIEQCSEEKQQLEDQHSDDDDLFREVLDQRDEARSQVADLTKMLNVTSEQLGQARRELKNLKSQRAEEAALALEQSVQNPVPAIREESVLDKRKYDLEQSEPEITEDFEEYFESLSNNLEQAGVDEDYSSELAAWLLAASFKKIPLVLAGPGIADVADALSLSLYASKALHIDLSENPDLSEAPHGAVWFLENGMEKGRLETWLDANRDIRTQQQVVFGVPYPEELALGSIGLYGRAVPIFTDFYVSDFASGEYRPMSESESDLRNIAQGEPQDFALRRKIPFSPLGSSLLKSLCGSFTSIYKKVFSSESVDSTVLSATMRLIAAPAAVLLNQVDLIDSLCADESFGADAQLKKSLQRFAAQFRREQ
jgi:hypothetical protein